jgi:uncharacterized protein
MRTGMGVEENKRIVSEWFARFDAGDVAGALDLLGEDATWWIAGGIEKTPGSGEHTKEQARRLLAGMGRQLKDGLRMTVRGMIAEGDRVAAEVTSRGELHDGKVYANEYHFALTLRDGKITQVREYMDTKHVEATWSQAP